VVWRDPPPSPCPAVPVLALPRGCRALFPDHRETLDALYCVLKVEPGDLLMREHEELETPETPHAWAWRGMTGRGAARKARDVNATPLALSSFSPTTNSTRGTLRQQNVPSVAESRCSFIKVILTALPARSLQTRSKHPRAATPLAGLGPGRSHGSWPGNRAAFFPNPPRTKYIRRDPDAGCNSR
jgi:hypothetical protein